jgi:DTW domain-containing protein YfiP
MHPKEARKKRITTGRLAHLLLKNSEIIVDQCFDQNLRVQELIRSQEHQCFLLYPSDQSMDLSQANSGQVFSTTKKNLIFILDGTWPCAKSMIRDSKVLHDLPRLSFPVQNESRFSIKLQPAKYCLSTIESIFEVLVHLDRQGVECVGDQIKQLLAALEQLVSQQLQFEGSSKRVGSRAPAKKWKTRNICYQWDGGRP